ncbi:MAG TPA: VOC family protein [Rariglobus sp.]|jgi:catechol 2,3-dioxygenase|nr:VOC family protein [Rariglobus sp.]
MSSSTLQLSSVRLRVADLDRAQDFYAGVLGLVPGTRHGRSLTLHTHDAEEPLLTLSETPGARPKPPGVPGLFHLALLTPDRPALARMLRRLAETRTPIHGLSDHGVSEAIYLEDPDGNGLELYADRPRDTWRDAQGKLVMFTQALDTDALLASASGARSSGLPAGTTIGHIHLRTHSLASAETFYTGPLGLAVSTRDYPGALFMGADGYHHHIAVNTWGRPAPAGDYTYAGLERIEITIRGLDAPRTLTDPDGLSVQLTPFTAQP